MIGTLLVAASFMIVILLAVLYLAFSIKRWTEVKDIEIKELKTRIDETQSIFRKEITQVLKNINNILPK